MSLFITIVVLNEFIVFCLLLLPDLNRRGNEKELKKKSDFWIYMHKDIIRLGNVYFLQARSAQTVCNDVKNSRSSQNRILSLQQKSLCLAA